MFQRTVPTNLIPYCGKEEWVAAMLMILSSKLTCCLSLELRIDSTRHAVGFIEMQRNERPVDESSSNKKVSENETRLYPRRPKSLKVIHTMLKTFAHWSHLVLVNLNSNQCKSVVSTLKPLNNVHNFFFLNFKKIHLPRMCLAT